MSLKNIFLVGALCAPLTLAPMQPGTVIDPLHCSGQFTVSMPNSTPSYGTSALGDSVKTAAQDIFKHKGIPVIISTAASMMPWWALTTGTGYLIISQCSLADAQLLTAIASGTSYAIGTQTNSLFKKYLDNTYIKNATQVALCAACLGASYAVANPLLNQAFFTLAQTIGFQTIIDASTRIIPACASSANNTCSSSSTFYLSPETKQGLINGTVYALSTAIPDLCISNCYTAQHALRVLLYEQTYRLAQAGCNAAEQFLTNKTS